MTEPSLPEESIFGQALEIEYEVGFALRGLFCPGGNPREAGEAAEFAARENYDFIDVRIAVEQRRPFGIDEPAQVRARPVALDQCGGG